MRTLPAGRRTGPRALPRLAGLLLFWPAALSAQSEPVVRIIQTNSAGTNAHIIDPDKNEVVAVLDVTEPHGAAVHPDGTKLYFTNEIERAVDVFDVRTLQRVNRIQLTNRPHNLAVSNTARKAYVAIINQGVVDVIDLDAEELIGSIPMAGGVHNTFVTPDHRYVVAGMIGARAMTVIDTETDEAIWSLRFDGGVRPMAFESNHDGSTKRAFVQISQHHGFYVVDWERREVVDRVSPPPLPLSQQTGDGIQDAPSHGAVVTPDMRQLWISSRIGGRIYAWSLPELEYIGYVRTGSPSWLTATPDSRYVYVGVANTNETVAVDTEAMEVVARIPVGQTPKRLITAVLPPWAAGVDHD